MKKEFDTTSESADFETISEEDENNVHLANVIDPNITDDAVSDAKLLRKINNLKINNRTDACFTQIWFKDCHLQAVSQCTSLISLEIYDCINLHGKLDFLKNLTNLQTLILPFCSLQNDDISIIQYLPNLTELDLHQNFLLTKDLEQYILIHPTLARYSLKYNNFISVEK